MFTKISCLSIFTALMLTMSASTSFAKTKLAAGEYTVQKQGYEFFQQLLRGDLFDALDPLCINQEILQNPLHQAMIAMGAKLTGVQVVYVPMGSTGSAVQLYPEYEVPQISSTPNGLNSYDEPLVGCLLN